MKSTIKFLVMTMLLMLVITAFAGCSLFGHTWTEATCTAPKTCTGCGATEGEPLGHTEQIIPAKEATCYETGLTEGKICSVCNEVLVEQKVVLSLGHDMVIDLPATATCTEPGLSAGAHCSRCDYKEEQTEIPALGHSYMFPCDAHCQVCGEFTNPNAAHTIVAVEAKAATCTDNGNVAYWYCSDCGAAWADEALTQVTNRMNVVIPTLDHTYMFACDAHCMVCGELTNPDAAHTINFVEGTPATCIATGTVDYYQCSICGYCWLDEALTLVANRMNVVIPTTGHDWELGAQGSTCTVCNLTVVAKIGDTYYETLEAALAAANGETIVLVGNVALAAPITIAKDDVVVIDLAGFVLSYESTTMNEAMITNLGSLTIKDSGETGEIFYNYVGEADSTYSKGNYTISNAGTLVIDGGKIHIATIRQHAKYPVNNNSTSGNATLIVNGGHLYNYNTSAIRMFCNSTTYTNTVIINGGLIEGYSAIWMQNPGKNTVNGQLTINGGEIRTTAAAYVNGSATVAEVASKIYCTAEGGAWDEASFIKITGGLFNENVNLETEAPAVVEIGDGATFNGYVKIHEHDFVGFSCETDGVCACGAIKPAAHTITYVAAVVPANCLETGHDEYWECTACGAYFGDAEASWQVNPAWMFFTGDCVRPEDAADCATVPCTVCGEDTYGQGEHDTGVAACQDGHCSKCGADIEGYGCQNYDTPACEDGFCFYCGGPVEGFGHENGAWAPCQDGECSYGCGLIYPATADHIDEDGDDYCDTCWNHLNHDVDPCLGGECSICWTYVEGAHTYAYPCDQICCVCYELTNPDATHTIVAVEAKAATCTDNGNIAYWYCSDCGAAWADEALTQVTNLRNVIIPAPGHADENGDYKCDNCSDKMLPADGTALTIPQAIAVAKAAGSSYSTQKYYITGIVTNVYNTTYGNLYLKDADGNQICIYGLYTYDGSTRYDAMSYKPVEGDELTVYTVLGTYNSTAQGKNAWMDEVVAHEHNYTSVVKEATCTNDGYTTHTCTICNDSYTDTEVAALGHTTENGTCERCGNEIGGDAPVAKDPVTFEFGANGSAAHVDGNDLGTSKTYTEGSATLNLTGMSKVFGPAYDAKGNSCIKLGTSSKTGSFTFTVDDDVTSVVIYVAGYKAATSTNININGTQYNVKTASNNGEYTAIEIDTTTTKTITFTSVTYRCMINSITYNYD